MFGACGSLDPRSECEVRAAAIGRRTPPQSGRVSVGRRRREAAIASREPFGTLCAGR